VPMANPGDGVSQHLLVSCDPPLTKISSPVSTRLPERTVVTSPPLEPIEKSEVLEVPRIEMRDNAITDLPLEAKTFEFSSTVDVPMANPGDGVSQHLLVSCDPPLTKISSPVSTRLPERTVVTSPPLEPIEKSEVLEVPRIEMRDNAITDLPLEAKTFEFSSTVDVPMANPGDGVSQHLLVSSPPLSVKGDTMNDAYYDDNETSISGKKKEKCECAGCVVS
jgi:hypothetical protein